MRRRSWPAALAAARALAGPASADDRPRWPNSSPPRPRPIPKSSALAARAADCARKQGLLDGFHRLAVIDYSLPSTQPRLWVFDVDRGRLLFQELVAHGRNTGEQLAERFSNAEGSKMSSLGLFQTADTYYGHNGYSLRLRGPRRGFQRQRAVARHRHARRAVRERGDRRAARPARPQLGLPGRAPGSRARVIDTLKGGALLFAYYPDQQVAHASRRFFTCDAVSRRQGRGRASPGRRATRLKLDRALRSAQARMRRRHRDLFRALMHLTR